MYHKFGLQDPPQGAEALQALADDLNAELVRLGSLVPGMQTKTGGYVCNGTIGHAALSVG